MNQEQIAVLVALVILIFAVFFFSKNNQMVSKEVTTGQVVDLLNQRGWGIALMEGCGWCGRQKEVLGPHLNQIRHSVVNRAGQGNFEIPPHIRSQIHSYPAWFNINTGEISAGFRDYNQMTRML